MNIEVFCPSPSTSHAPAVLVLPGGGYEHWADHEGTDYARWLSDKGFYAFVLRYPIAPQRHPAQLTAARGAVAYIRSGRHGLSLDRERVGVIGSSAGGHLAAMLCTGVADGLDDVTSRPDFAILCYPVVSFVNDVHSGCLQNLVGGAGPVPDLRRLSAELQVDSLTPPTFIWATADDEEVNVSHGLSYAAALAASKRPFELHVFPHGRHGLGLASDDPTVSRWVELCERWLESTIGRV